MSWVRPHVQYALLSYRLPVWGRASCVVKQFFFFRSFFVNCFFRSINTISSSPADIDVWCFWLDCGRFNPSTRPWFIETMVYMSERSLGFRYAVQACDSKSYMCLYRQVWASRPKSKIIWQNQNHHHIILVLLLVDAYVVASGVLLARELALNQLQVSLVTDKMTHRSPHILLLWLWFFWLLTKFLVFHNSQFTIHSFCREFTFK